MSATSLESTPDEKDLCVVTDEVLKFHLHVSQAVKKAFRMLGLVRAIFICLDETTIPRLFTTMVRPHLEYGNVIWHPRYRRDKLEVEQIQRSAIKLIPSLKGLNYEDILKSPEDAIVRAPQEKRRYVTSIPNTKWHRQSRHQSVFCMVTGSSTSGHNQKMVESHTRLSTCICMRQNVFIQRVVNDWNSILAHVVDSPTLNTFMSRLDKFWNEDRYIHVLP